MERGKQIYNNQYERWMPWIEDQYLYYFGKDNKASYATKDTLNKTQVSGIEPVDKLQGGVTDTVAGQVGKGGLLQPVGDMASKEGINRAERGGKDDKGSYGGPLGGVTDPMVNKAKDGGNAATEGAKGAGSYVGSFFGGKGGDKSAEKK
ncbi:hypothetical protein KVT40_004401 [Elsinoe batatas]|uniref:Uncharacterized protein n=1 Tax=Elsinoe batatas TaxID=2601811 RepID=A0A8K0PII4_9PEZI|nr:hypothetical protein KVT40_004401 [Elsinoe batatas]